MADSKTASAGARHKTFQYRTTLVWNGGRVGTLSAGERPSLRVSSPPEFKGIAGVWTPEDLFVGAVEMCHMSTFLAFASRRNLPLLSYESSACGTLEHIDGDYRFSRIVISPIITVGGTVTEEEVHAMVRDAHRHCLVANSITAVVEVNTSITVVA